MTFVSLKMVAQGHVLSHGKCLRSAPVHRGWVHTGQGAPFSPEPRGSSSAAKRGTQEVMGHLSWLTLTVRQILSLLLYGPDPFV